MAIAKGHETVAPLAAQLGRSLVVIDLGCRWGVGDAWSAFGRHATVIGFDADVDECDRLNRTDWGGRDVRYVAAAIGPRRGEAPFFRTREPACGSFFPPDLATIRHRPTLACITPIGTEPVALTTLDDWAAGAEVGPIDALKLDTQGSELGILQGGTRTLATVRALEVEVMFNPIYKRQPLFSDIDQFLRGRGFVLWRLAHLVHYGMLGARSDYDGQDRQCFDSRRVPFRSEGGQLYWGNAYYVRHEIAFGEPTTDWRGALRDACLASAFGFRDLAGATLRRALSHAPAEVAETIRRALVD
jgi:FkbM family methyltransferase